MNIKNLNEMTDEEFEAFTHKNIEYYEYKINMYQNSLKFVIQVVKDEYQIENIKFINDKIAECEAQIRKLKIENLLK